MLLMEMQIKEAKERLLECSYGICIPQMLREEKGVAVYNSSVLAIDILKNRNSH